MEPHRTIRRHRSKHLLLQRHLRRLVQVLALQRQLEQSHVPTSYDELGGGLVFCSGFPVYLFRAQLDNISEAMFRLLLH
jgi:hypothetical protein